jgi:hypothetical protein
VSRGYPKEMIPSSGGAYSTPDDAIGPFLAALLGDQLKASFAKRARANADGSEIAAAERKRRLAQLTAQIDAGWRDYEAQAVAAEAAGMVVARPADLPPAVFLEFSTVDNNFNRSKLRTLERVSEARSGSWRQYQYDQSALSNREAELTRNLSDTRGSSLPDRAEQMKRIGSELERIRAARIKLSDQHQREQREAAPVSQLLAKCQQFLREKNIRVEALDFLLSA